MNTKAVTKSKTAGKQDDNGNGNANCNDGAELPKNKNDNNVHRHPQPIALIDSDDEEELGALIYKSSRTFAHFKEVDDDDNKKHDACKEEVLPT